MPSLAAILIVRDEAAVLADCLGSCRDICDAIVVADTGSTDATPDIARRFGARVVDVPWTDDFAAARNAGMAHADSDWLLHLDADEMLDPAGGSAIRSLVDQDGQGADAIELTLANYCDDPRAWRFIGARADDSWARGHLGYIAVPLLRLFRNYRGYAYREPIHENITASVREGGGSIARADIRIHHYGFATPSREKAERYLAIARRKAEAHPYDPKALHDFAEQAMALDRSEEAEAAFRRALDAAPEHVPASMSLATLLLNRGDLGEAKTLLERVESRADAPAHASLALGAIALRQGRLQEASKRLEEAVAAMPRNPLARLAMARLCDCVGDGCAVYDHLEAAVVVAPHFEEAQRALDAYERRLRAERAFEAGDLRAAAEHVAEAIRLANDDPIAYLLLARLAAAANDPRRATAYRDKALALAPSLADRFRSTA